MSQRQTRRRFVRSLSIVLSALLVPALPRAAFGARRSVPGPHPTPRPGITGAKVLTKEQLADKPQLIALFDSVREIPQIVDGIRCNCGCASETGFYSLLSCYEGEGMARNCVVCQGQGRLAARLHKADKTLDEIRVAVDAKFA